MLATDARSLQRLQEIPEFEVVASDQKRQCSPTTARRLTIAQHLEALTRRREQQHLHTQRLSAEREGSRWPPHESYPHGSGSGSCSAGNTDVSPLIVSAQLRSNFYPQPAHSDVMVELDQQKRRQNSNSSGWGSSAANPPLKADGGREGGAAATSPLSLEKKGGSKLAMAPLSLTVSTAEVSGDEESCAEEKEPLHLPSSACCSSGSLSAAAPLLSPPTLSAIPAKPTPQQTPDDRRVDDLTVKQQDGGSSSSYSISLIYHDSVTGGIRTVSTAALPPLSAASKPPIPMMGGGAASEMPSSTQTVPSPGLSPAGRGITVPSATGHHSTTVQSGDAKATPVGTAVPPERSAARTQGSGCPTGTAKDGASTSFAAPLPPTEPLHGPRLQGVVGRHGEMAIGAFLGGGACGKVYECLNTETGQVLAAKQIAFDAKDKKLRTRLKQLELELEVLTLAAKHHMQWIVGFYGAEKHGHSVLMYLEYCQRGSLLDYIAEGNSSCAAVWSSRPTMLTAPLSSVAASASGAAAPSVAAPQTSEVMSAGLAPATSKDDNAADYVITNATLQSLRGRATGGATSGSEGGEDRPNQHNSTSSNASVVSSYAATSTETTPMSELESFCPSIPPLSIDQVQCFTRQMVEGLCFLHRHNYAHLDVKTANVLVTAEEQCRLADLGCAMRLQVEKPAAEDCTNAAAWVPYPVLVDHDAITELRGTALYMAPEMIRFERHAIGSPADIWSLGCVVMEMATGSAPWRHVARDKLRVLYRIGSARQELPLPPLLKSWAEEAAEWLAGESQQVMMTGVNAVATEPRAVAPRGAPSVHLMLGKRNSAAGDNAEESVAPDEPPRQQRRLDAISAASTGGKSAAVECNPSARSATAATATERDTAAAHRRMMHLYISLLDFIAACVLIHPAERLSAEELLLHPFLSY